jgi:Ca2+/Na+ antiporter
MPTAAAGNAGIESLVRQGPGLLCAGLVALFACSRALAAILPPAGAIGLRSLAFFIPIAAASLAAMLLGRGEIAVGIVFGTSVGALTTVVGFVALAAPVDAGPPRWRRLWPFQLVAALLVFVAGFGGTFKWTEAVALATEGLLLLALWNDDDHAARGPATTTHDVLENAVAPVDPGDDPADRRRWILLAIEIPLVLALLWLGAWMAAEGAVRTATAHRFVSTSAIAGSVISLALVLPMAYGAWRAAAGGRGWATVTTQMGVVLLNLCALLPALIAIPYLASVYPPLAHWANGGLSEGNGVPKLLLFPAPMWRIDNVLLIVAGALLLPVGLGKWALGREEGMILIAAYFFYLMATAASGLDLHLGH